MKKSNYLYLLVLLVSSLITSCDNSESISYPRKYIFNSININNAQIFLVQPNKNIVVLPNRFVGSFNIFTNDSIIKEALIFQNETEGFRSFNMKNKDEIEVEFYSDNEIKFNTVNVNNEADNGIILPLSKININLKYNSIQDELVICLENLIIFEPGSNGKPKHDEYYCSESTVELSAQDLTVNGIVNEGDTIGIYRLDYIYKRN